MKKNSVFPKILAISSLCLSCFLLNGCIVSSVVGLATDVVTTTASVAVKTTGAVAKAAIPDDDDDD